MSHFTQVRTKLRDLEALKLALGDVGATVAEGEVRGYAGQARQAAVVARLPGRYDVGFVPGPQGLEAIADWSELRRVEGLQQEAWLAKLTQRYAYHLVLAEAQKQGFTLAQEHQGQDATLQLTLRRW